MRCHVSYAALISRCFMRRRGIVIGKNVFGRNAQYHGRHHSHVWRDFEFELRRAFAKPRSVAMKRWTIGTMSFAGSLTG